MGADQTPDPTAWSDDQLDDLLDALAQRAAERDDLDLPGGGASRRGVLAGLLGLGGAAAGAGVASAIGESESFGSASGVAGTDSEPVKEINVRDIHAKNTQIDSLSSELAGPNRVDSQRSLDTVFTNNSGGLRRVSITFELSQSIENNLFITVEGTDGVKGTAEQIRVQPSDVSGTTYVSSSIIVPDGRNYEVVTGGTNGAVINRWTEQDFK